MTQRRIRTYAILTSVVVWTLWAVDMSRPGVVDRLGKLKGTDFLQFYVGGSFAREGRLASFYDVQAMHARAEALVPASRDTIYLPVQSPQTALLLAPLSALPYGPAVAIWFFLIIALYVASCSCLWRRCDRLHRYRTEVLAAAVAFPGLYSTILNGQMSVLALAAMTAAVVALDRGRPVVAGAALGCLAFKPHWCAAAIIVFLAAREWRVVSTAMVSAAVQIAAACAAGGMAAVVGYARVLLSVQRIGDLLEPRPGDSLRGFFRVFVPAEPWSLIVYAAASLVVLTVAARTWRSGAPFAVRMSAMIAATILISPHAFGYDLILLAPVYFLLANWLVPAHDAEVALGSRARFDDHDPTRSPAARVMAWSLCALFFAPLLTAVPAVIRLQFSVTAMAILLASAHQVRGPREAMAEDVALDGRSRRKHAGVAARTA